MSTVDYDALLKAAGLGRGPLLGDALLGCEHCRSRSNARGSCCCRLATI